jgi:O-antigen/teichoic acid export membrane protein
MHYIALQQSVNSTVVVIWVAASLILGASLPVMAAGLVVGQLGETLMGWSILRRLPLASRWMRWDRKAIVRIAAASFPFGLTAILLALNLRIDILVLSHYVSSRILGQFNAAVWFVVAMFLGASLLMSVLFPRLSRVLAEDSGLGSDYIRSLVKNVLMFAAVGSLLVWIAAPGLIRLFFGPDFSPAAHILRVLAPALPLVFLNTIFFYVFAAARRRFVCLGTLSLGIGIGTLLSVYLASRYGATGAATADVAREFAMTGAYLCFLIQGNHARLAGVALLKVFAGATALLVLAVQFAGMFHIRVMWLAAWMFFVLMGALVTLGFPNIREWHLLTDDRL